MPDRVGLHLRAGSRQVGILVLAVVLGASIAAGQTSVDAVRWATTGAQFEVQYRTTFSVDGLQFGKLLGYDTVVLEGGDSLNVPGEPMLPVRMVRVALPVGMAVTGLRVVGATSVELPGEYVVFPGQRALRVSDPMGKDAFVGPDAEAYGALTPYPDNPVEFVWQSDLAGQSFALLRVCPLRYVPAEGKLSLYTSLDVVLEGTGGYECGDYLPARLSAAGLAACRRTLAGLVVNPGDVELCVSRTVPTSSRGVASGEYDYVIITQSSWVDDFQPLADWKTQKGVPAAIVSTGWIYNSGGYSGTEAEKIRAFVQDAHDTWGAMFFLLGGDTNVVPYHVDYRKGEEVPNDTYYADYDEDWTCEVHVGRASVRSEAAISTFNDKVMTYEREPPATDYATTAAFFGFDLYAYGSAEGEGCKEVMRNAFIPEDWTYRYEYDTEGGNHKSAVLAYLNQGNNLANHIDHSSTDFMGTGYTNHGLGLSGSDMSGLSNGDRQSILYSIGCWACDYISTTCIAEAFVRNAGGGGVAFVGNSRYGWYSPYTNNVLSLRCDRYFFRWLFWQDYYRLGECFSIHKDDAVTSDSTYQYIYTELTLLGDPEMPIWTAEPQGLTVSHAGSLTAGEGSAYAVEVSGGGGPVDGATVCLWKDGDIYEVEQTGPSGQVVLAVGAATEGTMSVTVTSHNYLPYEGEAVVMPRGDGDFNGDGDVDLADFAAFQACFAELGSGSCEAGNLTGSGYVELNDFAAFAGAATGPN